jgi:hypothetical protein
LLFASPWLCCKSRRAAAGVSRRGEMPAQRPVLVAGQSRQQAEGTREQQVKPAGSDLWVAVEVADCRAQKSSGQMPNHPEKSESEQKNLPQLCRFPATCTGDSPLSPCATTSPALSPTNAPLPPQVARPLDIRPLHVQARVAPLAAPFPAAGRLLRKRRSSQAATGGSEGG